MSDFSLHVQHRTDTPYMEGRKGGKKDTGEAGKADLWNPPTPVTSLGKDSGCLNHSPCPRSGLLVAGSGLLLNQQTIRPSQHYIIFTEAFCRSLILSGP